MDIKIQLGIPYRDYLGLKEVDLILDSDEITLSGVLDMLYKKYPDFKKILLEKHLLSKGTPDALFIINDKVSDADTGINGSCTIKILLPMAGG